MISSSRTKREDAKPLRKDVNKSPVTLAAGQKPLVKHRFYLDLKNRVTANKLEAKIQELGGALELFLTLEVTHVITDREGWDNSKGGGFTPKTPRPITNESCSYDSKNYESTPTWGRPKTRADAMLEKARRTPTVVTKDPLEEARTWGVTLWTVEKAFAWLEKVTVSIKVTSKKRTHKFFELKSPYIKFETFDRQTRPVFQEIRNWPALNVHGLAGDPGVTYRSRAERNMTRKTRSNYPRIDTALQPGYCEVCRVEYPRLDEHLKSEHHLSFIKNNSNFIQLDNLINGTTNIESFLKINGINNCVEKCNGLTSANIPITRNKMPRTRTISLCDRIKNSPLSPTGSDSGHRLRSRRHLNMTNSYVGSTAEDDGHPIKPEGAREIRELRSSTRQLLKLVEHEAKDTWDSGRPKRSCIKQKRISSDERLVVDNRTYYKVEVFPNKLRSSGLSLKDIECAKRVQTPIPEERDKDKALIVKFKRMRTSELKRLNNEAENFLFPKKEETSSDDDIDADGPNTTVSIRGGDSTVILSSEPEEPIKTVTEIKQEDDASMDSNWSETSSVKKKKRRTHAEAFILDNQKYYKFETPGSRLRYQGSYLPPLPSSVQTLKHNGEHITNSRTDEKRGKKDRIVSREIHTKNTFNNKVKAAIKEKANTRQKIDIQDKPKEKVSQKDKPIQKEKACVKEKVHLREMVNIKQEEVVDKISLEDLQFSFERVPQCEPWYQTFTRQDQGQEYYTSLNESGYWKPFLLPYQMGPLPPLDPRICIKAYQQVKKRFTEIPSASTSAGCSTPDPHSPYTVSPELQEECSKTSDDSDMTSETRNDEEVSALDIENAATKSRRRRGLIVGRNPRKSPRQHASTLAILSSLIHQRKRRGDLNKPKSSDLDLTKQDLSAIPEIVEDCGMQSFFNVHEQDYDLLAKKMDDVLTHSLEDCEQLELSCEDDSLINVNFKLNAMAILHDYDKVKATDEVIEPVNKQVVTVCKKPCRKKKKKNRTGWPNKNRRRREVVKDIDDSTVDSLSAHAESDENEDNCDENNSNVTDANSDVNSIKSDIGKSKTNNSVISKVDLHYNNIDQSNMQLNVNNSLNIQSSKLETQNSCSVKQDRVIATRGRDICTDVVVPSVNDIVDRVVDLDKWENAEKVLSAKVTNNEINNDMQFQPYVRVQKLDSDSTDKYSNRRLRSSSSPHRTVKRPRRMPGSPKSPRILRKPRGRWYRER